MIGYDKIAEHSDILLDLPFYEGIGIITRDQAKPHHQDVDLKNTPTWGRTQTGEYEFSNAFDWGFDSGIGIGVITLDGANEYLELDNAVSLDLDFMASDYSIGAWIYWTTGKPSQIIIGRYQLDVGGWELYLFDDPNYYLSLRHHHAATLVPPVTGNPRSGCYSSQWVKNTWHFVGISRSGATAIHHRNGVALITTGTLVDPETCAQDLVVGIRFCKTNNNFKGSIWRPRVWNRALSASEWLNIFERERHFFGV